MSENLMPEDLSVIAMLWLVLCNLGYAIQDLDLSEPGYIQRMGPHTVYTFSVLLRDDEVFSKEEFCRLLDAYCEISPIKPHCYGIEEYPAHARFCFDTLKSTAKSMPMNDFRDVYVSVFL